MAKCNFCKRGIEPGKGKIFVTKEGAMISLCSTKCEKNMRKLKRNPAHLKWVGGKKK